MTEKNKKEAIAKLHHNTILQVAERLFLENGVENTSMNQIAKIANYSKTTVYVYFKSKEDIYNHVIYRGFVIWRDHLLKAVNTYSDFTDCYYAICDALMALQTEYPLYFDALLGNIDIDTIDSPLKEQLAQIDIEINALLEDFVQKGIQQGTLSKEHQYPQIIFIFWASIAGIMQMADVKQKYINNYMKTSKEDFIKYGIDTILEGIIENKEKEDK